MSSPRSGSLPAILLCCGSFGQCLMYGFQSLLLPPHLVERTLQRLLCCHHEVPWLLPTRPPPSHQHLTQPGPEHKANQTLHQACHPVLCTGLHSDMLGSPLGAGWKFPRQSASYFRTPPAMALAHCAKTWWHHSRPTQTLSLQFTPGVCRDPSLHPD